MRSYQQRCGLAKALDVIGDRWTLLIVRELLIRGACRYTDLRSGLPGIATNLLADRLRAMEEAGIVTSGAEPPPIAATLFRLTDRGRDLQESLLKLGQWGAPLLSKRVKAETMQPHWLVLPLKLFLVDRARSDPKLSVELRVDHESIVIEAENGKIDVRLGTTDRPDIIVIGKPDPVLQLLSGRMNFAEASEAGVRVQGQQQRVQRIIPDSPAPQNLSNPGALKFERERPITSR
jgi:DNA-binding HxlR family transcriptional regulator